MRIFLLLPFLLSCGTPQGIDPPADLTCADMAGTYSSAKGDVVLDGSCNATFACGSVGIFEPDTYLGFNVVITAAGAGCLSTAVTHSCTFVSQAVSCAWGN